MMTMPESSAIRYKLWQGIRQRQINTIKNKIRRLYHIDEKKEKAKNECQMCHQTRNLNEVIMLQMMKNGQIFCASHEKELISFATTSYQQSSSILRSLFNEIDIQSIPLVTLRRFLMFISQILFFPVKDITIFHTCQIIKYILDGWIQYRLDQIKRENSQSRTDFVKALLRECRSALVVHFLETVTMIRFETIGELASSEFGQERSIGLNAILLIINPQKSNNSEAFRHFNLPQVIRRKTKNLICEAILAKISSNALFYQEQIIELETQIIYECLQSPKDFLSLDDQKNSILEWAQKRVKKDYGTFSEDCRYKIDQIIQWSRNQMEEEI